jgi:hypothetical protein
MAMAMVMVMGTAMAWVVAWPKWRGRDGVGEMAMAWVVAWAMAWAMVTVWAMSDGRWRWAMAEGSAAAERGGGVRRRSAERSAERNAPLWVAHLLQHMTYI